MILLILLKLQLQREDKARPLNVADVSTSRVKFGRDVSAIGSTRKKKLDLHYVSHFQTERPLLKTTNNYSNGNLGLDCITTKLLK